MSTKKLLVVIDPGHYPNYNKGAVAGYYEGDKMYTLAEYEKAALEAYGIEVVLTRKRSNDMKLYDRGQVAVKKGTGYDNVLFMSDHSNAGGGRGVEAYRSIYLPDSATLGKKLIEAVVKTMNAVTGVTNNRGLKTLKGNSGDYYGVIRGSVSGATTEADAAKGCVTHSYLIEHGFHDHKIECGYLNKDANLKAIAEAKAAVIAEYFGYKKVTKPETPATATDNLYRVRKTWADADSQIGAYKTLSNAKKQADKNPGYEVYDGSGKCVYTPAKKSVTEIAKEVIRGEWGNGAERKKRLTAAGYDYKAVQIEVNKLI